MTNRLCRKAKNRTEPPTNFPLISFSQLKVNRKALFKSYFTAVAFIWKLNLMIAVPAAIKGMSRCCFVKTVFKCWSSVTVTWENMIEICLSTSIITVAALLDALFFVLSKVIHEQLTFTVGTRRDQDCNSGSHGCKNSALPLTYTKCII